jgi:hypothetical protein
MNWWSWEEAAKETRPWSASQSSNHPCFLRIYLSPRSRWASTIRISTKPPSYLLHWSRITCATPYPGLPPLEDILKWWKSENSPRGSEENPPQKDRQPPLRQLHLQNDITQRESTLRLHLLRLLQPQSPLHQSLSKTPSRRRSKMGSLSQSSAKLKHLLSPTRSIKQSQRVPCWLPRYSDQGVNGSRAASSRDTGPNLQRRKASQRSQTLQTTPCTSWGSAV